ncbi:CLUMA_CG011751, isoform A [Clunio marinus]|uniref:CLUMA_CG011751, isoform A n=1 Tax=Clunio marinus TaxID=568069 RepID=A0A1J1IDU7_9DIPT|nr:CLUMA_CG011751, isoform A [Clunio marinus]
MKSRKISDSFAIVLVHLLIFYSCIIKCFGKDSYAYTKDTSITKSEKLRICIVENRGSFHRTEKFCPTLEKQTNIECIIGVDRSDCARRISKGYAHFGVFSSEDLVGARWASLEILVTSEIRFHSEPFEYGVVVVVDNEANIHSAADLKSSHLCHPGKGLDNNWNDIISDYLENVMVARGCETEITLPESRIKATANYFAESCKAGPWVNDPMQDKKLKAKYPSLCSLCYNPSVCGVGDKHWGRRGPLYCLTSGSGEIAYVRLDDVKSFFGFTGLTPESDPNNYSYLCPDSHLQPLNVENPCTWIDKPWSVLAAKRSHAQKVQELFREIDVTIEWQQALLQLLESYHVNITSLDFPITIDDYLDKSSGYQSAHSFPACYPPRQIVYCTTNLIEFSKCSWLQEISTVYGIEPNFQYLEGKVACFPSSRGASFSSVSETLNRLNLIPNNCSSSVERFFSRKSCFGNQKSKYCKNNFVGEDGPLRCLKDYGDVAFMNLEAFTNFTAQNKNIKEFRTICPFQNVNKYLKSSDICYLSWTSKGVLLTSKDKSQMRINEIVNALKTMDNHFGKHKFRSGNIPFTLYGPFDQKNNVIFRDATDMLKTNFEFKKTSFERNSEDYFDSLIENNQYCNKSGSKCVLSGILSLITTTKTAARAGTSALKDEKTTKANKLSTNDKNVADKKSVTKKSDFGLSAKTTNGNKASIKLKSSSLVTVKAPEKPKSLSKKNVMNTIHNVTVASPPSSASKERTALPTKKEPIKASNHTRSNTRTIPPEDSILHKHKLLENEQKETKLNIKDPVAFDINFKEDKKEKKVEAKDEDEYNYESDFESYESDFESEVPSTNSSKDNSDVDDEVKSVPTTNIHKERDSGSFEMNSKKSASPTIPYDSIEDTINSHDSGISYDDLAATTSKRSLGSKQKEIYKRGKELMKKITFDEQNFNIFESKQIPYETFMSVYGQRGMTQISTQSESMMLSDEVQTDAIMKSEIWTQCPPKFTKSGLEIVNSKNYNEEKLGVGEGEIEKNNFNDISDDLSFNIEAINNFSKNEFEINFKSISNVNSNDVHKFIENAALTMSNVLDRHSKILELQPSHLPISRGLIKLQFEDNKLLSNTIITKIYTNKNIHNFLLTVHKQQNNQENILCLWDVLLNKQPIKMFKSWSELKCLEMHDHQRDVLVGGCNDGTICLWDVQEFNEWSDESMEMSMIKPCEIVSLSQTVIEFTFDNVVALRSLPYREHKNTKSVFAQSQASQICSLQQSGTVTIWTISRTHFDEVGSLNPRKSDLKFSHVKSRIKLLRNVVIELNNLTKKIPEKEGKLTRKSAFEKTRYYFENDLFNDKVLRELQEIDTNRLNKAKNPFDDDDLLRFNDCTIGLNEILATTDLNYIVAISRLNLADKTRKIFTNESSFVSSTVIKFHPINSNILAVGQANGEVRFMKIYDDDQSPSSHASKNARKSVDTSSSVNNDVLSKSCAFQNIVEKEKKLYDETQALNNLECDELKAFLVNEALSKQFYEHNDARENFKAPFDKNIFNSFEVSPGAVTSIEFNKMGEFMFVIVGKKLRIFNCWLNAKVDHEEKRNIVDVKCVIGADSTEYLILVTNENEVLINKLKH